MSRQDDPLYRVRFVTEDKVYEVFARSVYQPELFGFIAIEEMVFDTGTTLLVDPAEEKLKAEFEGVRCTMVPMHAVLRIDTVERRGTARILEFQGRGTTLTPVYTPRPVSD